MKQEEPCEGRLSNTVLRERRGVTPLRDPTIGKVCGASNHQTEFIKILTRKQNEKENI